MQVDALPLRQRQALETRRRILDQARTLFAERGYAGTTIADVARAAGVAVPTVYKTFGNKPGLLSAIVESWRGEFVPGGLDAAPADADGAIAWWARTARRQWETGYDIAMIFAAAYRSDPVVGRELTTRLRFRSAAVRHVGQAASKSPKSRLGVDAGAAVVSALTLPEVYRELVRDRGWTPDQYESWVRQTLTEQLLA